MKIHDGTRVFEMKVIYYTILDTVRQLLLDREDKPIRIQIDQFHAYRHILIKLLEKEGYVYTCMESDRWTVSYCQDELDVPHRCVMYFEHKTRPSSKIVIDIEIEEEGLHFDKPLDRQFDIHFPNVGEWQVFAITIGELAFESYSDAIYAFIIANEIQSGDGVNRE